MARHTLEVHTVGTTGKQAHDLAHAIEQFANTWLGHEWVKAGNHKDSIDKPYIWVGSKILERG